MSGQLGEEKVADVGAHLRHLARLGNARHALYRFLATALLEPPTEELVASLLGRERSVALLALFPGLGDLAPRPGQTVEGESETAREDFAALFLVPTSRYLRPFESIYAKSSRKGLLMGPPAWAVLQFYQQAGASLGRRGGLLPDHIAVEVSFMEFLCAEESGAWEKGAEEQAIKAVSAEARFLAWHLSKWVPELGDLMERNAKGAFYRTVARLLREVVARDLATLDFLLPQIS